MLCFLMSLCVLKNIKFMLLGCLIIFNLVIYILNILKDIVRTCRNFYNSIIFYYGVCIE